MQGLPQFCAENGLVRKPRNSNCGQTAKELAATGTEPQSDWEPSALYVRRDSGADIISRE